MTDVAASANTLVRRTLLGVDSSLVLDGVDGLDLRASARASAVVAAPLRQLQRRRDVVTFATRAPIVAVRALVEVLALEPLEVVVRLLGDDADSPDAAQLEGAIDAALASGLSTDQVALVLAHAVAESFPAAPLCRRLLEERPEFTLGELVPPAPSTVTVVANGPSADTRERRRARREADKRRRPSPPPPRRTHSKATRGPHGSPESAPVVVASIPSEVRRPSRLSPRDETRFRTDDPLVGAVVVATVPFHSSDPAQPEIGEKDRPALVVATSRESLLVRAIYSNPGPGRTVFSPWRRLVLEHVSYVEDSWVVVPRPEPLSTIGTLTTGEWNALTP